MVFTDFTFVYIDLEYLRMLYNADKEVFFSTESDYTKKPHLGILCMNNGREYVIPLTSAKPKHIHWRDVTESNYKIYEIVDVRKEQLSKKDIISDVSDVNWFKERHISEDEWMYYKKHILSVLEIKKMIPITKDLYSVVSFDALVNNDEERRRADLLRKEYVFLRDMKTRIESRASRIYDAQIRSKKVKPLYCNYRLLEQTMDAYVHELQIDHVVADKAYREYVDSGRQSKPIEDLWEEFDLS